MDRLGVKLGFSFLFFVFFVSFDDDEVVMIMKPRRKCQIINFVCCDLFRIPPKSNVGHVKHPMALPVQVWKEMSSSKKGSTVLLVQSQGGKIAQGGCLRLILIHLVKSSLDQ